MLASNRPAVLAARMIPNPYAPGYFREPGRMHLHVDGGTQEELVRRVVGAYSGKLHHILKSIAGPQRHDLPAVYHGHTPGRDGEQFEFFSTLSIASRRDAVTKVKAIFPCIASYPGITLELERIVLVREGTSPSIGWEDVPFHDVQAILPDEVPYAQVDTFPIEIHHGINIPKQQYPQPPLELSELLVMAPKAGMRVGGWFLFDKGHVWAYRSNQFTTAEQFDEQTRSQNAALHAQLQQRGIQYSLWSIAEQVFGLWKT